MPFQFFGTSGAIPSAQRDNTALAFYSSADVVLVDCGGSPYQKVLQAGLHPDSVSALIVTHRHVDHVYGFPSLAHNLGLAGRAKPLHVYALPETLAVLHGLNGVFPLEATMRYRLEWHELAPAERHPVLDARGFRILSSPVIHGATNLGLRVEFDLPGERGAVVYSCDTSPCDSLVALARQADVLIHEATLLHADVAKAGPDGHTTAYQAGELARRAGAKRLMLCHFHASLHGRLDESRREAEHAFGKPVEIPEELLEYRI